MEMLGSLINAVVVATGEHISLKNAGGVTFFCYEDAGAQAIAIKESIDGQSEQALGVLNHYYASNGVGGVWTRETADANGTLNNASSMVKKDTTAFDCASFYIDASQLSDGYDSVEVTIDGAGLCIAVPGKLLVQRAPQNLPAAAV